jgi:sec-independent protein translocase protein TatA
MPQGWDWVIIALVFLVLFGAKKLPEMARSVGQSARVFKSEMKGMKADDEARGKSATEQRELPAAPPAAASESVPQSQAGQSPGSAQ